MSEEPIFDMVILRCATVIDGIEYAARTSVPREDWEEAPEAMREWHRDMLRQELAAGIRDRLGAFGDHASLSVETCGPPVRPNGEPTTRVMLDNSTATFTPAEPLQPHYPDEEPTP